MAQEIKKTMIEPIAWLSNYLDDAALNEFTEKFGYRTTRVAGGPRESVKLFDADGNVLGRRCSVSHKWIPASGYNGDVEKSSVSREAYHLQNRARTAAKKFLAECKAKRDEMLEAATTPEEKLEAYEQFENCEAEAREMAKNIDVSKVSGFDTVEELAAELGVPVITTRPTKPSENGETAETAETV